MKVEFLTGDDIQPLASKIDEMLSLLKARSNRSDAIGMMYSNKQLAKRLNVSQKTLQSYRDKRLIEYSQVNRKILYSEEQVQRFLNCHRIKSSYNSEGKGGVSWVA
jgi:hypothetical protein